jgi:hypothetical protein
MPLYLCTQGRAQYPFHTSLSNGPRTYTDFVKKNIGEYRESNTDSFYSRPWPSHHTDFFFLGGGWGVLSQWAYKLWNVEGKNNAIYKWKLDKFRRTESSLTNVICGKFDKIHYSRLEHGTRKQRRAGYIVPRLLFPAVRPGILVLL